MSSAPQTDHHPLLLNLQQTQWRDFFNALPDATLVVNEYGIIEFANNQVEVVLGYAPTELAGLSIDVLIPERCQHAHRQHLQGYATHPKTRPMGSGLALYGRRKEGHEIPVEISLSHLPADQGVVMICCIRDVSARKRMEAALLNDERFQLFFRYAPSAIAMFDRDMRYLVTSQRWLEDYQLVGRDIIGLSHYAVFPKLPDHWKAVHQRCLAGETLQAEEEEEDDVFMRADGRKDWVRWQCHPWHTAEGDIGGIILFTEVITERKRAEIELRKREADFHGIFDNAVAGIVISDLAGNFQQCNAAYCKLLGYTVEEFRCLKFHDLVYPDDLAANIEKLPELLAGHLPYIEIENRYVRKNGDILWVRKFISTLPDESGQPAHFLVIVTDDTELKHAEAALKASHQNLERQVVERTQALEAARKQAEQANNFKSRFLAAASHDLRQPLHAVGLYLSVLAHQLALPAQQQACATMRESLAAMADLLDALLDISQLEGGAITPNKRDFSLPAILTRIVSDNCQQAATKGLQLRYPTQDCWVYSDPVLLERILENFVSNAIRYTLKGHVAITWECTDDRVQIAVSDTGIGIPSGEFTHIFDEYYQLDNAERDRSNGLGLGLAIVKHIAHILDHRLAVQSTLDQGSVFTVEVPLGKPPTIAAKTQDGAPLPPGHSHNKSVVLFIDDDPAIIKAMQMLLEIMGVEAYIARSGDEALAQIQSGVQPDIVVTDYRLPGYNGAEVIGRIRALTADTLPAVIISGDTAMQHIIAQELPHCTVLSKPVDTKRLLALIADAADKPGGAGF